MVKKMKLSSLFRTTDAKYSTWQWPSCRQPRTLSFRTSAVAAAAATDTSEEDPVERMIRGLRSERLLFEPAGKTSSIMEEAAEANEMSAWFKGATTMLSVESVDPLSDFRRSMEEMVEAHRLRDRKSLEELLSWYLRVNRKGNHGYILRAFVDLMVSLALASSCSSSQNSRCSPLSLCCSSCSSYSFCSSSSFIPCASSMEMEEITSLEEEDIN